MYCVYMSAEHLEDEPARELYGQFIDENYEWRAGATAETADQSPSFLQEESDVDVDLLSEGDR